MLFRLRRLYAFTLLPLLSLGCGSAKHSADNRLEAAAVSGPAAAAIAAGGDAPSTGPSSGAASGSASPASCALETFAQNVWAPVLAPYCMGCHLPNGFAASQGSTFMLFDPTLIDYMAQSYSAFQTVATKQSAGMPYILAKATNATTHGGGVIFPASDPKYAAVTSYLATKTFGPTCLTVGPSVTAKLLLRSNTDVIRKAALQLAGREPTPQETQLAAAGSPEAALNTILAGPYFASFIERTYNDTFLYWRFLGDNAISFYDQVDGIGDGSWRPNHGDLGSGVYMAWPEYSRIPKLLSYVIENDKPYTDMLLSNYMMFNPYTACEFLGPNNTMAFTTQCTTDGSAANVCNEAKFSFLANGGILDDCREFHPAPPAHPGGRAMAGVLSDFAFLAEFPSTATNRNRHRANQIFLSLLGLNIQSFGTRLPPGVAPSAAVSTATQTTPSCAVCHAMLDPVASAFQNYDPVSGVFTANTPWATDMLGAGYNNVPKPASDPTEPLAWLAQKIAGDPRFARTAVAFWYQTLTGNAQLPDPPATASNYREALAAKAAQNAFFDQEAKKFAANQFNTRAMIQDLILSPYYTTSDLTAGVSASEAAQLNAYYHAGRMGPEDLHGAIHAATGVEWLIAGSTANSADAPLTAAEKDYLLNMTSLGLTYGGIDSVSTTVRNYDMSSVASAIANFAAESVPCQGVAADFAKPAATRVLLPNVELTTLPDGAAGTAAIKTNIVYLHHKIVGETLPVTDPEIEATYSVFLQVYQNHLTAGDTTLSATCASGAITTDPNHTVHAWMAVVSYLLNDFDFLYR